MQTNDFSNLPTSWQIKPLNSFGIFIRGVSYKKEQLLKEKTTNSVFLLRANNIQEKLDLADLQIVPKELADGKIIQDNDIVFAMSSGSRHIVGKNIILQNLQDYSFGAFCGLFRITNKDLNSHYLAYFLQSDFYKKYIVKFAKGTNINNLRFNDLENLQIPLPPLEIQKRIVARLESAFEKIEKGSVHLQDAKTKLAKYKQSLLKSAFDGTLTAAASLRESAADEAIHKVDCHDLTSPKLAMTDKENPKLPQGWTIKTLGEICEINPKNKLDDDLEVSFIPMNLILDKFQNKFSYETKIWKNIKKGYTHFQNNCIALAKITPCFENGKCVILDNLKNGYGAGTTELIILLPNLQETIAKYIFYFLNTQNFIEQGKRNFKGTAGQLRISADFVANCKIPLPPLKTQKQIVKLLEKHLQHADKTGEFIESALNKAKQLKQSLLKSAFLGKLT